jgi:hypothetical protein
MANWYTSRERVKRAVGISGTDYHDRIDDLIEAMSRRVERWTHRRFIPVTQTRLYEWPSVQFYNRRSSSTVLELDADLLSVTTLQTKAQDATPTTISSSDYFLEPNSPSPDGVTRYDRIEIDTSSTASFESGDTSQRSISVAGSWGYSAETRSAGTVGSGLSSDATATTMVCSNGAAIDVGDTILIESEQIFVSDRTNAAEPNSDLLDGALTATKSQVAVTVDSGSRYNAGELIQVDSEKMRVVSITGNVLTVERAVDASVLAAHDNNTAVHVFRSLTIERGVNGTTGATHANATAISKYEPPFDIAALVRGETIAAFKQESGGWAGTVGAGEGERELVGTALSTFRHDTIHNFRRFRSASI